MCLCVVNWSSLRLLWNSCLLMIHMFHCWHFICRAMQPLLSWGLWTWTRPTGTWRPNSWPPPSSSSFFSSKASIHPSSTRRSSSSFSGPDSLEARYFWNSYSTTALVNFVASERKTKGPDFNFEHISGKSSISCKHGGTDASPSSSAIQVRISVSE